MSINQTPAEHEAVVNNILKHLATVKPDDYGQNIFLREELRCRALCKVINDLIGRDADGDGLLSAVIEEDDDGYRQLIGFRRFIKPGAPVGEVVG